jgi:hypothetical protein
MADNLPRSSVYPIGRTFLPHEHILHAADLLDQPLQLEHGEGGGDDGVVEGAVAADGVDVARLGFDQPQAITTFRLGAPAARPSWPASPTLRQMCGHR